MSTRPERRSGHGDHHRWLAVLGAVAAVAALGTTAAGCSTAGTSTVATAAPVAEPTSGAVQAQPLPPYVFEPGVRIRRVGDHRRPRRDEATGRPQRLVVPRLHVDAPVVGIGVTGGVLLPPGDPQTLGWWSAGAKPGAARGGALVTGHTVHTGGGAFDDLETLRPGDRVRVRTERGRIAYAVSGVTVYRKATLAQDAARIFRQHGPGRLVLITCEDWNGSGYDSNAVVFADPI